MNLYSYSVVLVLDWQFEAAQVFIDQGFLGNADSTVRLFVRILLVN